MEANLVERKGRLIFPELAFQLWAEEDAQRPDWNRS